MIDPSSPVSHRFGALDRALSLAHRPTPQVWGVRRAHEIVLEDGRTTVGQQVDFLVGDYGVSDLKRHVFHPA